MNTRGRQRELAVVKLLNDAGLVAYRLAHGPADVIALGDNLGRPQLIQVKSTSRPYERFGPRERRTLILEAKAANADAVLAWWPKRQSVPKWIDSHDWPAARILAA